MIAFTEIPILLPYEFLSFFLFSRKTMQQQIFQQLLSQIIGNQNLNPIAFCYYMRKFRHHQSFPMCRRVFKPRVNRQAVTIDLRGDAGPSSISGSIPRTLIRSPSGPGPGTCHGKSRLLIRALSSRHGGCQVVIWGCKALLPRRFVPPAVRAEHLHGVTFFK